MGLYIWKVILCGFGCLFMGCVDGDVEVYGGLSFRSCYVRIYVIIKSFICFIFFGLFRGVRCLLLFL